MTVLAAAGLVAMAVALAPIRHSTARAAAPDRAAVPRHRVDAALVDEAAVALTLLAAVLRGGGGAVESLEAVAATDSGPAGHELAVVAAAHRWGVPAACAWSYVGPGWSAAAVAWHAAHAAGAAPADLLDEAARRLLEAESRRVEAAVQRSGVLLVLPLGLCFLPGFIATTVVPVVLLLLADGLR